MNQEQLEIEQVTRGVARFEDNWSKARDRQDVGDQPSVKELTSGLIERVAEPIQAWMDHCLSGKPGRRAAYFGYVKDMEADTLAYLTTRTIINGLICGHSYNKVQVELGRAVMDECNIKRLFEHDSSAIEWVERESKRRGINARHMQRAYFYRMGQHRGANMAKWKKATIIQVGAILVDIFAQSTRLVELIDVRDGKKQKKELSSNLQLVKWVRAHNDILSVASPNYYPMVSPPRKWQDGPGGYVYHEVQPVKNRDGQTLPPKVALALDLMNSTVYRVNTKVLSVLQWAYDNHDQVGLLDMDFMEAPVKPDDIATNHEARRDYRKQTRNAHDQNRAAASVAATVKRTIAIADKFANEDRIWFPCQLDFRGRVYPMPSDLNPQGPDYSRGLLEFAEGKYLETTGALVWHKVHGANMFGEDKLTLAERVNWVDKHRSQVLEVAQDPIGNRWWTEAEKPFQFLQWCMDFDEVQRGGPSHIRVSMDGSCNGIQHFAAMLRDPVAAKAVNLEASERPNDIYQMVADRVVERLAETPAGPEKIWADVFRMTNAVDRKVCKRAVMVMPYGGTFKSTMTYVGDEVRDRFKDDNPFGPDLNKAAMFLSKHVFEATREVVTSGARVMAYFQACASIANKAGKQLSWRTPTGFIASQGYFKSTAKMVKTYLYGGSFIQTRSYEETKTLDTNRARNAISPNFVHSLDASAMMLAIIGSAEQGVTSFHCIHDDFGTHAADTDVLARVLREQFVKMYTDTDILAQFKRDAEASSGMLMPDPPPQMGFDLNEVLRSKYFFS